MSIDPASMNYDFHINR